MRPARSLPLPTLAAALAVGLVGPASAGAAPAPRPLDGLSQRLGVVARDADASPAEQARRLDLRPGGAGSLARDGRRLVVEVATDGDPERRAAALRRAGASVVGVAPDSGVVTVAVGPRTLRRIGALPGVRRVREVVRPVVRDADTTAPAPRRALASCPGGDVVSAGDAALRADLARADFGVDGTGVRVGILSDSYDVVPTHVATPGDDTDAADDVATGDLPGAANPCGRTSPVTVLSEPQDPSVGADEGRAMAQTIHDLAPGARLSFATAFDGPEAFAANIRRLQQDGATVITDDVGYLDEPFYQPGPISNAIADVRRAGVSYYTATGNDHAVDAQGRPTGSYESGALVPVVEDAAVPTPSPLVPADERLPRPGADLAYHDFDPGSGVDTGDAIRVPAGATLTVPLQWAQPWDGVHTDLDLYLSDGAGRVLAASENANVRSDDQRPFELVSWTNTGTSARTVDLSVVRFSGEEGDPAGPGAVADRAVPRFKVLLLPSGTREPLDVEHWASSPAGGGAPAVTVGPTVYGQPGSPSAVAVGAVDAAHLDAPEPFSSRGPVTTLFGPVRDDGTAATALATPQVLSKPDIASVDCVATTFFYGPGHVFCGTSVAAPQAAAVDALARQAAPWATVDQVLGAVRGSGRPVGDAGPFAVGSGLIDARAAVAAARAIPDPSTPPTGGSGSTGGGTTGGGTTGGGTTGGGATGGGTTGGDTTGGGSGSAGGGASPVAGPPAGAPAAGGAAIPPAGGGTTTPAASPARPTTTTAASVPVRLGAATATGGGRRVDLRLTTPAAGRLEAIATVPRPAGRRAASRALAASRGRIVFARLRETGVRGGAVRVTLARTTIGRRVRVRGRTLRVRLVVRFVPTGGAPLVSERTIAVRVRR